MAKREDDPKSSGRSSKGDSGRSGKKDSGKQPKASGKQKKAPPPEDDEPQDDEDFVGADDPAADFLDSAVKSTPWWAISLAFHGLVLACLPPIAFSHKTSKEAARTAPSRANPKQWAKPTL